MSDFRLPQRPSIISKVGDKPGHPFRGNQHTKVAAHVKSVVSQLKAKHGEELANKMKPIVESALKVWHSEGDLKAPLVVGGKKRQYPNGQDMTAQSVMDTIADEIGMKGLFGREFSAGDFTSGDAFSKGDYVGHPFRGNQWTKINSAIKAQTVKVGPENVQMELAPPVGILKAKHGIQKDWHETVSVDPAKRSKVAKAYDDMPMVDDSPEVRRSWDTAEVEIRKQFETLKASGVKIEFVDSDPYTSFHDMHEQFLRTGTLKVLKTEATGGHPYWKNEVNDMFRAVHDAYGHLGTGRGFDRHGEEAAFQAHRSMFPPEAHPALATELRGQNQFLIDRGYFGEQKLGFLPADLQKKYQQLLEKMAMRTGKEITSDDDNNYALGRSHHVSGGRHFASAKQISKENPTSSDVHVDSVMGAVKVINPQKKRRDLKKKKMAMEIALQKADKPLKDPKGGLTAAGRAKFNRETGSKLRPGVRGKADTPEKMRRKGSFLTRFFTNPSGPMVKPNGEPTRLALSANAWGEPVPKNMEDAKKLAQKGRNLLERYDKSKMKKGDYTGHPFRGNQWTKGKGGTGAGKAGAKKETVIRTKSIDEALDLISQGKVVELDSPQKAATLIDKLKKVVDEATAKGEKAKNYDLCKVTVPNTNLFCGSSKGINRINMPQFSGEPVKGSPADKMPKNSKGEVDGTAAFTKHMEDMGVKVELKTVKASELKASQNELVGAKVAGMVKNKDFDPAGEAIFVSRDGYVIDGHHRWAAQVGRDLKDGRIGDLPLRVRVVDMPISQVLKEANRWAGEFGIAPKAAGGGKKVKKTDAPPCIGCGSDKKLRRISTSRWYRD